MRGWGLGQAPLDLLAERDSIFRLLAQTTPENISKNFDEFSINPGTRYPNLNKSSVSPNRIKHLFDNKNGPIDQQDGSEPMDTGKDLSTIEGGGKGEDICTTILLYFKGMGAGLKKKYTALSSSHDLASWNLVIKACVECWQLAAGGWRLASIGIVIIYRSPQ